RDLRADIPGGGVDAAAGHPDRRGDGRRVPVRVTVDAGRGRGADAGEGTRWARAPPGGTLVVPGPRRVVALRSPRRPAVRRPAGPARGRRRPRNAGRPGGPRPDRRAGAGGGGPGRGTVRRVLRVRPGDAGTGTGRGRGRGGGLPVGGPGLPGADGAQPGGAVR